MRKGKSIAQKGSVCQENDLINCMRACRDGVIAKETLGKVLYQLADNILKYADLEMPEGSQQGAVDVCLEKMERFNYEKGKAFNFFTTIILCYYRQVYRANKNLNELLRKAG